jgi:hypothetical protein
VTLNKKQFHQQAMDIIQRSDGWIKGNDAKTIFSATNIRSWPMIESPSMSGRDFGIEEEGGVSSNEVLNTAQGHLHGPTLRKYMDEGAPEMDPAYEDRKYLPEVLTSPRGRKWIDEGHHRIVSSRLRGETGTDVYEGYLR